MIRAESQVATAEDAVTITLEHLPEPVTTPPAYTYTSPSGNHQTASGDRVEVAGGVSYQSYQVEVNNYHYPVGTRTQYVSGGNNYQTTVGGSTTYNYSYSNPGEVSTGAVRAEGTSTAQFGEPDPDLKPSKRKKKKKQKWLPGSGSIPGTPPGNSAW